MVRRLLVLTVLLVLAMGTVAFAAIGPPPQHGQVDISIDVKPWVRISVPSTLTIEFIAGESGGFKDFVAKVRGNIGYVVTGAFSTDTVFNTDFSFAHPSTGQLPEVDNGKFVEGPFRTTGTLSYQYEERQLNVRVAAHALDYPAGIFGAGSLTLTIAATN